MENKPSDLNNDREHPIENFFDEIFDEGWKDFMKEVAERNRKSNYRLLKVVERVKGKEYLAGVKAVMKKIGSDQLIQFSSNAKGAVFNLAELSGCGPVHINQRSTSQGMMIDVYIPIKKNKYIWLGKIQ